MAVRCDAYNQVAVLTVEGDLTGDNALALRKNAEEQIHQKQIAAFVIDFERCGFADSEGLETLLWLKRRVEELFGQLKLTGLDENFRKILEITRLEHRFDCQKDLAAALKLMR